MKRIASMLFACFVSVLCLTGCGREQGGTGIIFITDDKSLDKQIREAVKAAESCGEGIRLMQNGAECCFGDSPALPELFHSDSISDPSYSSKALYHLLGDVIGFSVGDVPGHYFVSPSLPKGCGYVGVKGISAGGNVIDIIHEDGTSMRIDNVSGNRNLIFDVFFEGDYDSILISGTRFKSTECIIGGRRAGKVTVSIPAGGSVLLHAVPR